MKILRAFWKLLRAQVAAPEKTWMRPPTLAEVDSWRRER